MYTMTDKEKKYQIFFKYSLFSENVVRSQIFLTIKKIFFWSN